MRAPLSPTNHFPFPLVDRGERPNTTSSKQRPPRQSKPKPLKKEKKLTNPERRKKKRCLFKTLVVLRFVGPDPDFDFWSRGALLNRLNAQAPKKLFDLGRRWPVRRTAGDRFLSTHATAGDPPWCDG